MKLLIASNNQHKIEEIKAILNEHFDDITSLGEEHIECEPEETGKTFEENALIKARATAKLTNLAVLADDTGLCVNALGGKPGIYSARYASSHNSLSNRQKLLSEMHGIKDRSAYFECVVVLRYPDGKEVFGKGRVEGYILDDEQGENGFGYDCIFYSKELGKSFANASTEEKLSVSHRSRALKDLLSKLN